MGYLDGNKEAVVEITGLKKRYGDFQLNIPAFSVFQGECIGLIGENGAGKSTFIKLILNMARKDEGRVRVFGETTLDTSVKGEIGAVFERCHFSGLLCINELNRILRNVYKSRWNDEQFFDSVKRHSLPLKQPVNTFSQGMKAKLSLFSVFAHSPKLIILDEATSNLDPVVRREINREIKSYARRTGCSVLFSSHLVNELELFCDRIFFIDKGSILIETNPEELQRGYYIVDLNKGASIPKEALAVIDDENRVSCLTYGAPTDADSHSSKRGVSADDLMYYMTRGERIR